MLRIGCDFPMWMQYMLVIYMASFLLLFSDFYYKVCNDASYKRLKVMNDVRTEGESRLMLSNYITPRMTLFG